MKEITLIGKADMYWNDDDSPQATTHTFSIENGEQDVNLNYLVFDIFGNKKVKITIQETQD